MFERFTERARQVVVLAQDAARKDDREYIRVEHVLLGVLGEEEGIGARVLEAFDVNQDRVWTAIRAVARSPDEHAPETGQVPFMPECKTALELALREALSLGHNYIGTEHVLLGLVRQTDSFVREILDGLNVTSEQIRNEVIRMLSGPRGKAVSSREGDTEALTVTLARGHVAALLRLVEQRPHSEQWSKAVYDALREAMRDA